MELFYRLKIGKKILASFIMVALMIGIIGVIEMYNIVGSTGSAPGLENASVVIILASVAEIIITVILGIVTARNIIAPLKDSSDLKELAEQTERERDAAVVRMNSATDSLTRLILESESIADSISDGNLLYRGSEDHFSDGSQEIIKNINKIIEILIDPLKVSTQCFDKISKGDIPKKITTVSKGDFTKMNCSINACIDTLNTLIEDSEILADEMTQGNLSVRAGSENYDGNFAKMMSNLNLAFNAVIEPFNAACLHTLIKLEGVKFPKGSPRNTEVNSII